MELAERAADELAEELAGCLPGMPCACRACMRWPCACRGAGHAVRLPGVQVLPGVHVLGVPGQESEPGPPTSLKPLRGILRRCPPPAPIDVADALSPKDGADTPSTAWSPTSLGSFSPKDSVGTPSPTFSPRSFDTLSPNDSADAPSPKSISHGLRRLLPSLQHAQRTSPEGTHSSEDGADDAPSPPRSPRPDRPRRRRWSEAAPADGPMRLPSFRRWHSENRGGAHWALRPPASVRGLLSLRRAVGVLRAGGPPAAGGGAEEGRRGRTDALAEALAEVQEPPPRRVCFSHETPDTHDVSPYSNQYGIHPSFFDFDAEGDMRLTFAGIAEVFRRREAGLPSLEEVMDEYWRPAAEF